MNTVLIYQRLGLILLLIPALISCNSTDRLVAHVPDDCPIAIRLEGDQLIAATMFGGDYFEEDTLAQSPKPLAESDTASTNPSQNQSIINPTELTASGLDLMGHAWVFMLPEDKRWTVLVGLKDPKALEQLLAQKKCNKRQTKDPKIKVADWPIAGIVLAWDDEKFLLVNDTAYSTDSLLKLMNTSYPQQADGWKAEISQSKSAVDLYASSTILKAAWNKIPMVASGFAHAQFTISNGVEAEVKLFGTRHLARRILGGVQEKESEEVWHRPLETKNQAFSLALRLDADTLLKASGQAGWFQYLLGKVEFMSEVIEPMLKDWNGQLVYERLIHQAEEPEKWQIKIGLKQKENAQGLLQKLYQDGWLQKHKDHSYQLAGLYKLDLEENQLCWTAPMNLEPSTLLRESSVDNACVAYLFMRPGWFNQSTWNMYSEPLPEWMYALNWMEVQLLTQEQNQPYSRIKLRCMPSKKWVMNSLAALNGGKKNELHIF